MRALTNTGLLIALVVSVAAPAAAATARIAVATNFVRPLTEVVALLEKSTGHRYHVSSGSTGKLYAQIARGAPFDLFFAADEARPQRLEADALTVPGSRFTYALGRLVYWTADADVPRSWFEQALGPRSVPIAIANEKLAPYGVAALQVLGARGQVADASLLRGENVGHAFTLVATGHAALGLVAASSVVAYGGGTALPIAPERYAPIRQDAALLLHGQDNAAAEAMLRWFESSAAGALLERWGYSVPKH